MATSVDGAANIDLTARIATRTAMMLEVRWEGPKDSHILCGLMVTYRSMMCA